MITAVLSVEAFNLLCPVCSEPHTSPSGSHLWTVEEYEKALNYDVQCVCGALYRIPRRKMAHVDFGIAK